MIDDATIKRVAWDSGLTREQAYYNNSTIRFARAIEQLARQEQREEDAIICEHEQGHWQQVAEGSYSGIYDYKADAARECAVAIRAAGKDGSNG